ncbi:MAG: hypothetical protein ACFFAS_10325 [Promethearchaeota archaeon]
MSNVLLDSEKAVFEIVRDYLNEKKAFDINKILPIITSQFAKLSINVNITGIERILYSLVRKRILVEGSTLLRSDVLNNHKRNALYQYICNNPGNYLTQLENKLNLSHHVTVWHLKTLIKFNFIEKQEFDNHDLFYATSEDFSCVKMAYLTSNNGTILRYLKENDVGISKTQLSRDLGIHIITIDKRLEILMKHGLITREYIDNSYLYFINE